MSRTRTAVLTLAVVALATLPSCRTTNGAAFGSGISQGYYQPYQQPAYVPPPQPSRMTTCTSHRNAFGNIVTDCMTQ